MSDIRLDNFPARVRDMETQELFEAIQKNRPGARISQAAYVELERRAFALDKEVQELRERIWPKRARFPAPQLQKKATASFMRRRRVKRLRRNKQELSN
jgi:hypothetical protein